MTTQPANAVGVKHTPAELAERCFEESVRIEQVICLAGAIADGDSFAEPLSELLEYDDILKECFTDIPDWVLHQATSDMAREMFAEWAYTNKKFGFAVQIATPVMTPHESGGSYSWGHYRTRWVYADTFDAAMELGFAWVAEVRNTERGATP